MTPERWQRIGALFEKALTKPGHARQALVRASSEPADIQDEVVALLTSHDDNAGFLEPPSHLEPGAQVGAYRIVRILGRGGMGVVYLADDTRLHRAVALKALPPHLFRDERMRSRLRQEARAAAALSHPSIATVYALEEIDNQVFIASEYLEGQTLREELAGGAMPAGRAVATALEIGRALVAAHDRGIVHRDLKPENIVRTLRHSPGQSSGQASNGAVKILDFGLAQFDIAAQDLASVTRLTDPGVMAGTPPYMAPEQLLGQPTSARTDQFAFGVLLYELITGRHPFGGDSLPTVIARVLSAEPEPDARIPDPIWQVIARSVEKKPEDRFDTTAELVSALERAGAVGTLGTSPLGTLGTVRTVRTIGGLRSWWETHQLIVAVVYWLMAWPAWHVHKWTGRWGVLTLLATLAAIIVGGNLRLHLWFTSRTYPSELPAQRAYVSQWIRAADVALALILIATGLVIADAHTAWGALLVAVGLGAALAFLIIEPATARAALGQGSGLGDQGSAHRGR
ncbi:MAG: serine/threonine-protein kinase [Acidobacteriota bacterium]|nr:serine/threonine-protein kinase [Acidobacteriota bacterium]